MPATRRAAIVMLAAAPLVGATTPALAAPLLPQLEIMAPAAAGSGWSQTAQAMKQALEGEGLVARVAIVQVPGAGGTVGLARFVKERRGRGDAVLLTGLVMVGAVLAGKPAASLDDVTPLARLAGDYEVVVVPAGSDIKTLTDLTLRLATDTRSVSWAGGSLGGTDHMLAALLTHEVGGEVVHLHYAPYAGGGESLAALLGGHVTVGVNGYQEFATEIAAGRLRALAISAPGPVPGIDIPTFEEQGVPLELVDWRGVMAAPGIDAAQAQALGELIARMVRTSTWKATLEQRRWQDLYQPAEAFGAFLEEERRRVRELLARARLVK
ncbi:Bug family tripartite tricarboxylate transporter substrate binding protein [Benzoatithermus flavus]|uniref:Tripartite tricarboxylate transporter substrate-binding protein n=1 Tax=Benzoatithermus flavus TaxID=3108223 RepID=A0ABU8XU47_9PROT